MFKWLILGETGYLDPEEIEEGEFEDEEEAEDEEKVTDDVLNVNEVVEIEKKEREPQQQKQKLKKHKHTEHHGHSEHGVKIKKHQTSANHANSGNKRGRKPKHAAAVTIDATVPVPPSDHSTNDSLSIKSHDIIVSPKTINPLERMKIEALISSTTNNM